MTVVVSDRWISDARIVAEVTRAKIGGAIHVIGGPREGRVTIYSQQCRAINLVCALREREPDLNEKRVAVIGAGAAGMTAAGAVLAMGLPKSMVTVYEGAASSAPVAAVSRKDREQGRVLDRVEAPGGEMPPREGCSSGGEHAQATSAHRVAGGVARDGVQ